LPLHPGGAEITRGQHIKKEFFSQGANLRPVHKGLFFVYSTTDFTDYTDKAGAWYTLHGRKLDKKPTRKGLYIYGGRKVVIP
jgi:hypothetical protein